MDGVGSLALAVLSMSYTKGGVCQAVYPHVCFT